MFSLEGTLPSSPGSYNLPEDIAETVLYVANLPQRAVVEDITVWGIDKQVNPL